MDLGKLGHLMFAGGLHGLFWGLLEPASTAPDCVGLAAYVALLFSGFYLLGVILAPSPPGVLILTNEMRVPSPD